MPNQKTKIVAATLLATKKGLRIVRNSFFLGGFCITLPNGSTYNAKDVTDLTSFVKGY